MASRVADGADDAHGRADDQGTGTGHDQQGQRPIEPTLAAVDCVPKGQPPDQRGEDGDQGGQNHHCRGVDFGEAVHKTLGRGLLGLGLLHQADEAGDGVVRGVAGDFHFQRALAVDAAGEDLVAGLLVHGHALAGDGGLVDPGEAGQHHAVHGDALAGAYDDGLAQGQIIHGDDLLLHAAHGARAAGVDRAVVQGFAHVAAAVHARAQDRGCVGGHFHQATDGVAAALHGVALQRLAHGKEDHDQPGLGVRADDHRTDGGNGHEHVDGDAPVDGQAGPGAAGNGQPGHDHGSDGSEVKKPMLDAQHGQKFVKDQPRQDQQPAQQGQAGVPTGEEIAEKIGQSLDRGGGFVWVRHVVAQFSYALDYGIGVDLAVHGQLGHGEVDLGFCHPVQAVDAGLHGQRTIRAVHAGDGEGLGGGLGGGCFHRWVLCVDGVRRGLKRPGWSGKTR